jgi:hypothetical protein
VGKETGATVNDDELIDNVSAGDTGLVNNAGIQLDTARTAPRPSA